jgi:hypothetical protein
LDSPYFQKVLREGNVIQLPSMAFKVAEACSGFVRSYHRDPGNHFGYLLSDSVRTGLAGYRGCTDRVCCQQPASSGTGVLVRYWDPTKRKGFSAFSGLLIFVVSLGMLFVLHKIVEQVWPDRRRETSTP